jgi:hypothetical protein
MAHGISSDKSYPYYTTDPEKEYELIRKIGSGTYGGVYKVGNMGWG